MKRFISSILCAVLIITALLSLSSCNGEKSKTYKTRGKTISYVYFNTVSTLTVLGEVSDEDFNSYVSEAERLLSYYHKLFDIYYDYSGVTNIRKINQGAGNGTPIRVDAELLSFLEYCKELFTLTDGKTNVMMGAVLKIWHNARENAADNPKAAALPSEEELKAAEAHTLIDSLVIDREAGTVYISDPSASLDVGAIGKGYATERLYERLCEMGANHVALNIGGNIRTIGLDPNGEKWQTNLTNPDKSSAEFAAKFKLGQTACVTSGNYERYFAVDGVNYHHIIDPDTLMPARYFSSVTVITEDSALADALSTALFCVSYSEGIALLKNFSQPIEVIWIDNDFNIASTSGVEFVE
ncbi:MAG: FAD:protein FMN transferase [Clostridia bacterium]|nr:FAD:protein FMN transferase [Clostridia bacterium]